MKETAAATQRFPQPQFETSYQMPLTGTPSPRADMTTEYLDVLALVLALSLAAYLALRRRSRRGMLFLSLLSLAYFGFWRKGCVCPVGAIQNITLALTDPAYAVPATMVAFFTLPLLFALLFGRVFCAGVCPLGMIQDLVILRPLKLPRWITQPLGLLRHIYLGAAILLTATGAGFIICRWDPFVGFFRLGGHPTMLITGAALLILGTIIARPYCRFVCPYSLLLQGMSVVSKWHLTITPDECVQCRLCENSCPFDAINKPTHDRPGEPRAPGRRRLALRLASLPLLIVIGGAIGFHVGPHLSLSQTHRTVRLAEQLERENQTQVQETDTTLAFRGTGIPAEQLFSDANVIRTRFRVGGTWLGACIGLVIGYQLLTLSLRRSQKDYEPDHGACLSCARCFAACPKEQQRLKEINNQQAEDPPQHLE